MQKQLGLAVSYSALMYQITSHYENVFITIHAELLDTTTPHSLKYLQFVVGCT